MVVREKFENDSLILDFEGEIDEDAVFPDIDHQLKKINLKLGHVSQINSCGIREWIKWTKSFSSQAHLVLEDCPKVIIDQINTVDGFLPKGTRIHSFKVPYFCEACDRLMMPIFQVKDVVKDSELMLPSATACHTCKKEAEMDVIPERYFKFLQGNR